jgi:hypothetical protein
MWHNSVCTKRINHFFNDSIPSLHKVTQTYSDIIFITYFQNSSQTLPGTLLFNIPYKQENYHQLNSQQILTPERLIS